MNGSFRRKKIGTFGDVSVYSASSVKTLDTYGGGFVFTDDHEMAHKLSDDQGRLSKPSRLRLLKKIQTDLVRNLASQPVIFAILTFPILRLIDKRGGSNLTKFTGDRDKKPISSLPSEWFESYSSIQARVGLQQIKQMEKKDAKRIRAISGRILFRPLKERIQVVKVAIVIDSYEVVDR